MKQQEITFHTTVPLTMSTLSLFHWCQHQLLSVVEQNVMKVVLYHCCHTLKNIIIETCHSVFELDLFKTKWPYLINSHEGRHFYFSYENKYTFPHNFKFQQCRLNNIRGKLKVSQRENLLSKVIWLQHTSYITTTQQKTNSKIINKQLNWTENKFKYNNKKNHIPTNSIFNLLC